MAFQNTHFLNIEVYLPIFHCHLATLYFVYFNIVCVFERTDFPLLNWGTLLTSAFSDMVLPIRVGNCSLSIDREKVATIVPSVENYFLLEKDSFILNE